MTRSAPLSLKQFHRVARNRDIHCIDDDGHLNNLARGYWVYDHLLEDLHAAGFYRFAAGFKSGVFGHPDKPYCIKIMGLGVGTNPLYFCERGYYITHERAVLEYCQRQGYAFAPRVYSREKSVRLLVDECGVRPFQAHERVSRDDLLIQEYISGVPFVTQTGHRLNYDLNIAAFDEDVINEMAVAVQDLKAEVQRANEESGFLHNDPMPFNIIFTTGPGGAVRARLVDYELAQIPGDTPFHVANHVPELYRERDVPRNSHTNEYTKNLDQHLLDEAVRITRQVVPIAKQQGWWSAALGKVSLALPLLGQTNFNLGNVLSYFRGLL